jgi:hypothetical protein
MKPVLKYTAYVLLQLIVLTTHAQSKVVVEQIQSYSMVSPTANYWQLPNDINPLLAALDSGLFKQINLIRDKNYKTITIIQTKPNWQNNH